MVEELLLKIMSKITDKHEELINGLHGVSNEGVRAEVYAACDMLNIIHDIIDSVYDEMV